MDKVLVVISPKTVQAQPAIQAGFTLVELVITIVIMGILASVAAPRFFERDAFDERGYYEDTLAALRYAQKLAVATGCEVQVSITAGSYTLKQRETTCASGAFTRNVFNPGNPGNAYTKATPSGLTLTPNTLTFNGLGQASDASITLTGSSDTRTITVVGETGFVY
jgi:MSHA pilin protein MshC